jgi:multidrug efflux system membrane fusion protein
MTIDPRPYQATLDQAKGQLARDQAQLENNQAEFNRYKALYDQGVVSKEQSDSMQSNLGQFVGAIKSDQAAIESAQLNIIYCHIKSPIDGKVGLRKVDPGNLITANTTQTLIVNQFRPIAVYFTLPEDQLQRVLTKLRQDHKLDAIAFDRSDTTQLESGQLTAADNQIDTTTGTDKLKAVFANTDEKLFPNQFVNVHLVLEQRKNAIVVPAAAVQHGTDNDYVWLVKPDTNPTPANPTSANGSAEQPSAASSGKSNGGGAAGSSGPRPGSGTVVMQPVDIDTTQGSMVILKSGLEANQQVVVDGADKLQSGSKVSTTAATTHRAQKQQQQLGPA